MNTETLEPTVTIIDDPKYADAAEYFDPCPPLEELVSTEVAKQLLNEEEQLEN